jgi:hypothetical protein
MRPTEGVVPLGSPAPSGGTYFLIDRNGDPIEVSMHDVHQGDRLPRIGVIENRVPAGYMKFKQAA